MKNRIDQDQYAEKIPYVHLENCICLPMLLLKPEIQMRILYSIRETMNQEIKNCQNYRENKFRTLVMDTK